MGFLEMLAGKIAKEIGQVIADEVILTIRKQTRMHELDKEAQEIKSELDAAQSTAEREAVLDKVYDLINGFGRV